MSIGDGHIDLSIGPPEAAEAPPRDFTAPPAKANTSSSAAVPGIELADPDTIRGMLAAVGMGAGYLLKDPDVPGHWRFSDDELDALAAPLARIVNRTPKLLEVVKRGDELTVGITLAGYVGRNVQAGSAARKTREEDNDGQPHQGGEPARFGLGDAGPAAQGGRQPAGADGDAPRFDPTLGGAHAPGARRA